MLRSAKVGLKSLLAVVVEPTYEFNGIWAAKLFIILCDQPNLTSAHGVLLGNLQLTPHLKPVPDRVDPETWLSSP